MRMIDTPVSSSPASRESENLLLEELSECDDGDHVGTSLADPRHSFRRVDVLWGYAVHDAALRRIAAAWTRRKVASASCRAVWLRDEPHHLQTGQAQYGVKASGRRL